MSSKIGAHVMSGGDPKRWVNAGAKIFKFTPETLGASAQVPAGALVIGKLDQTDDAINLHDWKHYYRDGWQPQATAQFRFNAQLAVYVGANKPPVNRYAANPRVDAWEMDNEIQPDNSTEAAWLSDYSIEMMRLFDSIGKKYALFNFAVGTPQLDVWPHLLPAVRYARDKGHLIGLHEYMGYEADMGVGWKQIDASRQPISVWHGRKLPNGQPDETRPYGWAALRYRYIYDTYFRPSGVGDVKLIISELGCDSVESVTPLGKSVGTWKEHIPHWQAEGKDPELTYAGMLKQYDAWIREDSYVVGATIFTVGSVGNWANWDISNTRVEGDLLYYIKAVDSLPDPPTEPPQPPQEPPVEQYKAIYVLCPSSATLPQMKAIQAKWYAKGRTIGRSIDDAISLMESPRTRDDSFILVHGWKYFSKAEQAVIKRYNYKLDYMPGDEPTTEPQPEPEPPAGPVVGIDISHHQSAVNWSKFKASNASFIFIRCSNGLTKDTRVHEYATAARAAGVLYGLYHYYQPKLHPVEQAAFVASLVEQYGTELPVVCDLEESSGVTADYPNQVLRFLDELTFRLAQIGINRKPIIYTSAGYWNGTLKSPSWGKDYDLWIAAWTTAASPAIPAPWSDWRFWQFTSNGKGSDYGVSSARIDLNRWNGTAAQLAAYRVERKPAANTIDLRRFKIADPDCWRVVRMPDGRQEDVQDMDLGGGMFVRRKGDNGEWHRQDGQLFYLIHDTSPDKGEEGIERVYTLYKDGKPGAPKSRVFQAVGEEWIESGTHTVQFRAKSSCLPLSENSGQARNSSVIVRYEKNYTFNRYGQGLTFDEVVWEKTGVETQIYGRMNGRACGWIGWSAPWGESEPVEVHWNRGRLTQEPKRWCSWG